MIYGYVGISAPPPAKKDASYVIRMRNEAIRLGKTISHCHIGGINMTVDGDRIHAIPYTLSTARKDKFTGLTNHASFTVTHNAHAFITVNYTARRIHLTGRWKDHYFTVNINYEDFQFDKLYDIKVVNDFPYEGASYTGIEASIHTQVSQIGGERIKMGDTIYVTADNNSFVPKTGASGNIFIKSYKEEGNKISFAFAFYGTVEGEYVGLDETARGALEPNYKMVASGFGTVKEEERHLIFSFRMKGKDYIFRYISKDKPQISRAYFVTTDDARTQQLLKEVPEDAVVGSVPDRPVFYVSNKGLKTTQASEDNVITEELTPDPPKRKKVEFDSPEDFARSLNPQTHIKERPEVVHPSEGTVNKDKLIQVATDHLRDLRPLTDTIFTFVREGRALLVTITLQNGQMKLRMVCGKTRVSVQYMTSELKWKEIKSYESDEQGKAAGRLVKLVKNNVTLKA